MDEKWGVLMRIVGELEDQVVEAYADAAEAEAECERLRARLARRESTAPMTADEIARMCPPRLSTVGEARGWVVGYAAGREDALAALRGEEPPR